MSELADATAADRPDTVTAACPRPRMLGAGIEVPCVHGAIRRYVYLDLAANTHVMADVWDAVADFAPRSSSVHRGSGMKSQVAIEALEARADTLPSATSRGRSSSPPTAVLPAVAR